MVSFVIALLTIGSTFVRLPTISTISSKDDRAAGRFIFIPTTLAKRKSYYLTSRTLSLSKIDHYGSAADPFPIVEKLRETINTITDEELQLRLTDAFIMARDKHTRWTTMAPYCCFYATTGVTFTFIEGDADMLKNPTIQAGDELLAINGLFVDWFEKNKFISGAGANVFGGYRAALKYLTTIYGKFNRLPSDDSINFQFKSHANPDIIYTVNVPYVSRRNEDCWNLGNICTRVSLPESTNMGIIKLDSFSLDDVGTTNLVVEKATMIIRSLLVNELKDTTRSSTIYVETQVVMLSQDYNVNPYAKAWQETKARQETKAWQETEPGSRFSNVFFLNSVESANTLGQVYVRPMGVLNDGRCYSACEVFSGGIQGHGAGTILEKMFPFSQELTSGSITYANTLSVGVTQIVRTGRYNGQTIEDAGIEPEIIVRPRWSDLQPNPTTNTQYDRIAESLARTGPGERSE
ncbi:hypothetical protein BASA83_012817 [Batrachochytrium salamandrivorans]|nr:hypothetical protein BASA83_012817 [Batrachochytrium salamandrivorans]